MCPIGNAKTSIEISPGVCRASSLTKQLHCALDLAGDMFADFSKAFTFSSVFTDRQLTMHGLTEALSPKFV